MKIPKNAIKKFEGILFNVYHYQQKMFDGSYETFERLERKPTVDMLPLVGDKIIVIDQEQPGTDLYPSMVAGRIEKGEEILVAAERELLEETGYRASSFKIINEYLGSSKIYYHEYLIVAHDCQKIAEQSLDAGEKIQMKLVNFDEFLNMCRDRKFAAAPALKFEMYEALLNEKKKEELRNKIFKK
ncbi:MAG: NUDIX hydrolase [Parcubacteria group bacterium]|nr:NUDIX hydrolase [Parcubacteria group bacterium]